jgi:hypothetical protein
VDHPVAGRRHDRGHSAGHGAGGRGPRRHRADDRRCRRAPLSYASTQDAADAFAAQPYAQIVGGHHATLVGDELIAAVSPPTVLSMTWGLDDYLTALSAAA